MGFESRAAGSRHRTEQPIAPRFFICLASGHHDFFAQGRRSRGYAGRNTS
jgi:hypothetical protein